jgi:pimeloyl-ACP methyl ester carboxylesterase
MFARLSMTRQILMFLVAAGVLVSPLWAKKRPKPRVDDTRPSKEQLESLEVQLPEAQELEHKLHLPLTKLYDTPLPARPGKPGELIATEQTTAYRFPMNPDLTAAEISLKTVRFLYRSKSIDGHDVPATGVVLIPWGQPPPGGWPVVVWAHGTSGVGRVSAPSLMKDVYYSWEGLLLWTMMGFAVVAPDYAGLGTTVPHAYLAAPVQARDIIYCVPAARAAVPQLSPRWITVGHSQGGTAVLFVGEMEGELQDPNYLGAIAVGIGGDLERVFESVVKTASHGYFAFLAYGIKAVFPEFRYEDWLTPEAIRLMPVVNTCGWYVGLATFGTKVKIGRMMLPSWKKNPYFQKFRQLSYVGTRKAFGPVLLLTGLADTAVPPASTKDTFERMKRLGTSVEYRTYEGLDHDPLMFASFRDQHQWAMDRFAGRPVRLAPQR